MAYMVSVAELRALGISESQADEPFLEQLIVQAERSIEAWSGWWFEARPKILRLDGNGSQWLELPVPVKELHSVTLDGIELAADGYVVYSDEEDRFDPRLYREYGWYKGRRNVELVGDFGFVEADGSVPQLVKDACVMLIKRFLLSESERRQVSQESAEGAQVIYEKVPRFAA